MKEQFYSEPLSAATEVKTEEEKSSGPPANADSKPQEEQPTNTSNNATTPAVENPDDRVHVSFAGMNIFSPSLIILSIV